MMAFGVDPGTIGTVLNIASTARSGIPIVSDIFGGIFGSKGPPRYHTAEGRSCWHLVKSWNGFKMMGLKTLPAGYHSGWQNWGECVQIDTPIPIEITEEALSFAWPCATQAGKHAVGTEAGCRCFMDYMMTVMQSGRKQEILDEGYRRIGQQNPCYISPSSSSIFSSFEDDVLPEDNITSQMGKGLGILEEMKSALSMIPLWGYLAFGVLFLLARR